MKPFTEKLKKRQKTVGKITSKSKKLILNLGCGNNKIKGAVNIDLEQSVKPDLLCDFRSQFLPYDGNSVDEIYLLHVIEHIEEKFHGWVFQEIKRVLKPTGFVMIAYPEFEKIAQNYISNFQGRRQFWKHTLYGLQRYPGDYHVSLMDSQQFKIALKSYGFTNIIIEPEASASFNSVVLATKGEIPLTYEEVLKHTIGI